MSESEQLKCCLQYINVVMMIKEVIDEQMPYTPYALEQMRQDAHEKLCQAYGLTIDNTWDLTGNMPDDITAAELHAALKQLAKARGETPK